jgi:hypothetical protein
MSSVDAAQIKGGAEGPVFEQMNPTDKELKENPELAINVLLFQIWLRIIVLSRSRGNMAPLSKLFEFMWEWVLYDEPSEKLEALRLGNGQDNPWDAILTLMRIKKRGRPVTPLRHTAIKALFYKEYLKKSWAQITRRYCHCGRSHDDKLTLHRCQQIIEVTKRRLENLLKENQIDFPPVSAFKSQLSNKSVMVPPSKAIPTPEGLQQRPKIKRDITSMLYLAHPAIALLYRPDNLSLLAQLYDELDKNGEAIVLTMCDPAVKGWVPLWFPELRTSRPIESRAAYEEVRLEWFDKAFRHFAGARWPLRGSVAEQMRTVADTLRLIYRAACDDTTLELDNLLL